MNSSPTLRVDTDDPTPPYEQLRRQLTELIVAGVLPAGERLPPLRQLAGDLGLAVGTVARTYRELESAGLVRSRRGGGTRVAERAAPRADECRDALDRHAAAYLRQARLLGADREAALDAIRRAWNADG
ncbi:GntR family transcriptional regulator [Micromonospora auratinigra]|uniref:DNA-binding transcriptional regulator YhcF, GntR family n=1 Tax=Micromonospora auratinigra TaxID=261654 RepID=A0A1A9A8F5_9ACTN|nr:GntR family transcriptional regulator [Micromonospora auratinigra]SBT52445.1 DNA-binding transcriptional regulator YhcF, GntR family [Micromonospora auratinigra]